MPLAVLPFREKGRAPSLDGVAGVEETSEEDRRKDVARRIAEIMESCVPATRDQRRYRRSISRYSDRAEVLTDAGNGEGPHVVTERQFKLLQWAEKQLEIRRLQDECETMLAEIRGV